MKLTLPILASLLLLGGCATSRTVIGQDGKPVHQISCSGQAQGMDACYAKAGDICGTNGYDVVREDGSSRPFLFASGSTFSAGSAVTRSLTVRCRA